MPRAIGAKPVAVGVNAKVNVPKMVFATMENANATLVFKARTAALPWNARAWSTTPAATALVKSPAVAMDGVFAIDVIAPRVSWATIAAPPCLANTVVPTTGIAKTGCAFATRVGKERTAPTSSIAFRTIAMAVGCVFWARAIATKDGAGAIVGWKCLAPTIVQTEGNVLTASACVTLGTTASIARVVGI